jgi:Type I restriction enzyme R protein N terminus (HSDR_N)
MQLTPNEQKADILVTASQGHPVLVVEVKRQSIDRATYDQLRSYAQTIGADFLMAVDPQEIIITRVSGSSLDPQSTIKLATPDVLGRYTDLTDFRSVEGFYLESLVEGWLRDFSFSWKSSEPPGFSELSHIGLASLLKDSETRVKR